ncbi:MAG: GNAT family N-acetyltransferase [Desulfobacterales bacterium]|nr:GNAT family N-acetyltransferase [Desulfobacterales bacterium]
MEIIKDYIPGTIGRISELHSIYYYKNWGFGSFFESKVASELSEFIKRYDIERDGLWLISSNGNIEGSIVIDGIHAEDKGAHLRWFIVSDGMRGKGLGNELISSAVSFCKNKGYKSIYLWTFEGLHAARHLYDKNGFKLVEQHVGKQWGKDVNEQCFVFLN